MTATIAPAPAVVFVALAEVFVLADHIPAVAVDYTGTAYCADCYTDLGKLDSLAAGWVDLTAVDNEAYARLDAHLDSGEATSDCLNELD